MDTANIHDAVRFLMDRAADPRRLWEGRPPGASAALTGARLAGVERLARR